MLENKPSAHAIVLEKRNFIEYINRATDIGINFSLYENIYIEEYIDQKKIQQRANGFYRHIKSLTFTQEHKKEFYGTETQFCYYREDTQNQLLHNVYIYDINSAFPAVFKYGKYPITDNELGGGIVEEDEVGFITNAEHQLKLVKPGGFALYRFKMGYSAKLQKWAWDNFNKKNLYKSQGKTKEAAELKLAINSALGVISNHNIFLRCYITDTLYQNMEALVDENTLIANTDSIISLVPRPDLEIGKGLGQFKVEYENVDFIHEGNGYDVIDPVTKVKYKSAWRGRAKGAQEGFDVLSRMTTTGQTYQKIGDYIYGKDN